MSGLAVVTIRTSGMVEAGFSCALRPGMSVYRYSSSESRGLTNASNFLSTLSCLQVYRDWLRAMGHPFRICRTVGERAPQRVHLASTCFLQKVERGGQGVRTSPKKKGELTGWKSI